MISMFLQSQYFSNFLVNLSISQIQSMLRLLLRPPLLFRFCAGLAMGTSKYTKQQLLKLIQSFPYCKFPNKIHVGQIENIQNLPKQEVEKSQTLMNDAVAFGSISFASPKLLLKYHQKLFSGESLPEDIQRKSHEYKTRYIFTKYFLTRMNSINFKESEQEKQYYLKVLYFLCECTSVRAHPEIISSLKNYFDTFVRSYPGSNTQHSLVCQTYLIRIQVFLQEALSLDSSALIIEHLEHFAQQLKVSKQPTTQKLKLALIILNTKQIQSIFPQSILIQSLKIIEENLESLDDWQTFRVVSNLFEVDTKICKPLIEKITEKLVRMVNQQKGVKVPLIIKLMNLLHKKKMKTAQISKIILDQPQKFFSVFMKRQTNKEVFMEVILGNMVFKRLPQQMSIFFNEYIAQSFQKFAQSEEQIEFREISRMFRFILKYFEFISEPNKLKIKNKIKNQVLEAYEQHPQVCFWAIIYLFRMENTIDPNDDFLKKQTLKLLQKFDAIYKNSTETDAKKIALERILDLHYQLLRKNLIIPEKIKQLTQYSYKSLILKDQQKLIYIYNILLKDRSGYLSQHTQVKIFGQTRQKLQHSLQTSPKFAGSFKNLITIANIIYKTEKIIRNDKIKDAQILEEYKIESNIYLWTKLQKNFVHIFKHKKYDLVKRDWQSLKRYLTFYTQKLQKFCKIVDTGIKHPENLRFSIEEYEKQMEKKRKRYDK